jgi:hypothetical protein
MAAATRPPAPCRVERPHGKVGATQETPRRVGIEADIGDPARPLAAFVTIAVRPSISLINIVFARPAIEPQAAFLGGRIAEEPAIEPGRDVGIPRAGAAGLAAVHDDDVVVDDPIAARAGRLLIRQALRRMPATSCRTAGLAGFAVQRFR